MPSAPWSYFSLFSFYRSTLSRCCNAPAFLFTTQKNTPLGTKLKYEVDTSGIFHINQEIFKMFPKVPHASVRLQNQLHSTCCIRCYPIAKHLAVGCLTFLQTSLLILWKWLFLVFYFSWLSCFLVYICSGMQYIYSPVEYYWPSSKVANEIT